MSEFLKFAYELLAQVVYNVAAVFAALGGLFYNLPYLSSDAECTGKNFGSATYVSAGGNPGTDRISDRAQDYAAASAENGQDGQCCAI